MGFLNLYLEELSLVIVSKVVSCKIWYNALNECVNGISQLAFFEQLTLFVVAKVRSYKMLHEMVNELTNWML